MSKKTHSLKAFNGATYKAKDNDKILFKAQKNAIFLYLKEHTATASMVSDATGIPHKNICRYKRDLEIAGRLWEIEKKSCKITGFKAWYLTTDKDKVKHLNIV